MDSDDSAKVKKILQETLSWLDSLAGQAEIRLDPANEWGEPLARYINTLTRAAGFRWNTVLRILWLKTADPYYNYAMGKWFTSRTLEEGRALIQRTIDEI